MVTTISAPDRQEVANASIVLRGVSWLTFKALMADVGDDRAWRIAYDQGVLEIRMPLLQHEVPKGMIEYFVTTMADELEEVNDRTLQFLTGNRR